MEHDEHCRIQNERILKVEIQQVRHDERMMDIVRDLKSAIERWQEEVEDGHALKTALGTFKAEACGQITRAYEVAVMTRNILFAGIGAVLLLIIAAIITFMVSGGFRV